MQIDMGIIKLEVSLPEVTRAVEEFKKNRIKAFEAITTEVRAAVGGAINQLLKAEMTLFLGKPDQENNKRNGYQCPVFFKWHKNQFFCESLFCCQEIFLSLNVFRLSAFSIFKTSVLLFIS